LKEKEVFKIGYLDSAGKLYKTYGKERDRQTSNQDTTQVVHRALRTRSRISISIVKKNPLKLYTVESYSFRYARITADHSVFANTNGDVLFSTDFDRLSYYSYPRL